MKKFIALLMTVIMLMSIAACGAQDEDEQVVSGTQPEVTVNVAALSGPTGISMAKLAVDAQTSGKYNVSFAGSPDELVGKITTGEIDVACVPTNLAAVLYNKTGGNISVAAVTTLGVLYLIDTSGEISSIAELSGKTVGATGQGSNPEYILDYILSKNGLTVGENVYVDYKSEHAELATLMATGEVTVGMLPVPFATQVMGKYPDAAVIDLQQEWGKVSPAQLAQGVIIVRNEFLTGNKDAFDRFLDDFAASSDFAVSDIETTAQYVEQLGIIPSADVAKQAIPLCNITYIDGGDMKATVSAFLDVLYQANPKSVGGAMPGDDFYYAR